MNENNVKQAFENYISHFEEYNNTDRNKISEYYKWEIAGWFKDAMDTALKGEPGQFADALKQIKNRTNDFIDNVSTWPLDGLRKIAKTNSKEVQKMFCDLYAEDHGDLNCRQEKIENFLEESRLLREQYKLSEQYKNNFHSVTKYLTLYDPAHNYIYKPNAAKLFAKITEFSDDFGAGDHVKLKNYYRMCDELVEVVKNYSRLKELDEIRSQRAGEKFEGEKLYKDDSHHILVYDIIYCVYRYNLIDGITLKTLTAKELKEQKLLEEKQQKALELLEKLKNAQEQKKVLDAAMEKVEQYFSVGQNVTYKSFGKAAQVATGTIVKRGSESITIDFGESNVKTVGLIVPIVNGYIRPQDADENDFASVVEILKNKSTIENNLSKAEREFVPYSDYI